VPPLAVTLCPVTLVSPGLFEYDTEKWTEITLTPELALRKIPHLDLSDSGLLDFMNAHGPLTSISFGGTALLPHSPSSEGFGLLAVGTHDHAVGKVTRVGWNPRQQVSADQVRDHVRALRAIVSHWEAFQAEDDKGVLSAWSENGFAKTRSLDRAWDWWTDYVNAALSPFAVTVDVQHLRRHGMYGRAITAYSAMVLEIANDVTAGTAWRRCANEPCGQLFARQQGRAEAGQFRTEGIRFCTKSCAKAQMSRDLRRRNAEKRKGEGTT
jgi:hypothetical protein